MKYLFVLVFWLWAGFVAEAQRPTPARPGRPQDQPFGGMGNQPPDTSAQGLRANRKGKGSQIVDDSTKNIYGPKTSLWTTEAEIFWGQPRYQPLDTSLRNYHRWTRFDQLEFRYQDLGVMGSALNPIFPQIAQSIGTTSGFTAYDPYWDDVEPIYFDTKSPFTRFRVIWGGGGRAATRVEFSRNINPRWNFGFNYRPILIDKQYQRRGKGDRVVIHHYYDFYTTYRSKDERYQVLANFRRMRHRVRETGPIVFTRGPSEDSTYNSYFGPANQLRPSFASAESEELRTNFHVLHQYRVSKWLQVYQSLDVLRQENGYADTFSEASRNLYDTLLVPAPADGNWEDRSFFHANQTEIGMKGQVGVLWYNFYYRLRTFANFSWPLSIRTLPIARKGTEHYVGGRVLIQFDSLNSVAGQAEWLTDGNYKIQGTLQTQWLEASLLNSLAKPSFKSQIYRGSFHAWLAEFQSVGGLHVSGSLKADWRTVQVRPGLSYSLVNNAIFFERQPVGVGNGQRMVPRQVNGLQQVLTPHLRMQVPVLPHLFVRPQLQYTSVLQNAGGGVQVPAWFANVQLSYENYLFKKAILIQAGVDMHYRSAYAAMGYEPAVQQYFVQQQIVVPEYFYTTVFLNGQLKRGRFFIRYTDVLQPLLGYGMMSTPFYPQQRNLLDFGFDLYLFD